MKFYYLEDKDANNNHDDEEKQQQGDGNSNYFSRIEGPRNTKVANFQSEVGFCTAGLEFFCIIKFRRIKTSSLYFQLHRDTVLRPAPPQTSPPDDLLSLSFLIGGL